FPSSIQEGSQGSGLSGRAVLPNPYTVPTPAPPLPSTPEPTLAGGHSAEHVGTTKTKLANGGGTEAKEAKGPIPTGQQPNSYFPPVSAPPQGRGINSAHSLSGHLSLPLNPPQVAATAYAAGMGADGMRDERMGDTTDTHSWTTPELRSASTPHPTLYLATPLTLTSRQAGCGDPTGDEGCHFRPAGDTEPQQHPRYPHPTSPTGPETDIRRDHSICRFFHPPPTTQPSSSLPSPTETDLVLRPCHSHPDVVAPPPIQPVAHTLSVTQEGTSIRYEASAPADAPPSRVAEPPVGPHLADGEGHTTACTSDPPLHPPFLAPGPVLPRGPAPSTNPPLLPVPLAPPVDALHSRGAPVSTPVMDAPPQVPPDDDLPSTASSDGIIPNDPADTITSPEHPVTCPTCRCILESTRALRHHTPFCHPADAARWAQAVHYTTSILPLLSLPRATGIPFPDAQWQTLDSMDSTGYPRPGGCSHYLPSRCSTDPFPRSSDATRPLAHGCHY
ncbi:unnamed protein product, partial [Closterium sp. Naga37s-1]